MGTESGTGFRRPGEVHTHRLVDRGRVGRLVRPDDEREQQLAVEGGVRRVGARGADTTHRDRTSARDKKSRFPLMKHDPTGGRLEVEGGEEHAR